MNRREFLKTSAATAAALACPAALLANPLHKTSRSLITASCPMVRRGSVELWNIGNDYKPATAAELHKVVEIGKRGDPTYGLHNSWVVDDVMSFVGDGRFDSHWYTIGGKGCPGKHIVIVGSECRPASMMDVEDVGEQLKKLGRDEWNLIVTHHDFRYLWLSDASVCTATVHTRYRHVTALCNRGEVKIVVDDNGDEDRPVCYAGGEDSADNVSDEDKAKLEELNWCIGEFNCWQKFT